MLVFVALCAMCGAWIASGIWFGEPRLRYADVSDRLRGTNNEILETGETFALHIPDDAYDTQYQCPYCDEQTELPLTGGRDFSPKDYSRFNKFSPVTSANPIDHFDIYCSGCKRPVRVIANVTIWLGMWDDFGTHGEISFNQVIESEF